MVRAQAVTHVSGNGCFSPHTNMTHLTQLARLRVPSLSRASSSLLYSCPNGHISQIPTHPSPHTTRSISTQSNNPEPSKTFQPGNRLFGKKCLITGGTSGIGFAIAERFLREGASTIVLVGRSSKRLEEAASRLAPFGSKSPPIEDSDNSVTTRAPEEDSQKPQQGKIRLLVGDVSDASSWMRELEKEMASCLILTSDFKSDKC